MEQDRADLILVATAWVEAQGVVLQSAKGPVPNVADFVAGEPIRGSWWGHPAGSDIYAVLEALEASGDVASTRLVNGKVTLVHRRIWPALIALADHFDPDRLSWIVSEHTETGAHRNRRIAWPDWVPDETRTAGNELDRESAWLALPDCLR